jgi:hypothetical protein
MTKRLLTCAVLFLALEAAGGGGKFAPARAQEPEGNVSNDIGLNIIVALQGQLDMKRKGWSAFTPARLGTTLQRGDLLRLEGSSQAKVVCAGLTVSDVPRDLGGVPCPATRPILIYLGDKVTATRGYDEGVFPRVIAPRKTKLLNPRPTLLWMPVAGATGYNIIVRGQNARGQNPYWKTDVPSGAKLDYPAGAPPLEADTDYKLIVSAGGRQSDEEAEPGLGFALLKSDRAKEVRDAEKKIRALGLPDAPTRLVVAYLYAAYDLNAEAIEQLEGIPETLQEPAPARLLGALYLAIGLSRHAEKHYLRALEFSRNVNDEEGQALAHKELGRIYDEALGARNAAIRHFEAALNWYKKLGDQQMASHIEEKLAKRR